MKVENQLSQDLSSLLVRRLSFTTINTLYNLCELLLRSSQMFPSLSSLFSSSNLKLMTLKVNDLSYCSSDKKHFLKFP